MTKVATGEPRGASPLHPARRSCSGHRRRAGRQPRSAPPGPPAEQLEADVKAAAGLLRAALGVPAAVGNVTTFSALPKGPRQRQRARWMRHAPPHTLARSGAARHRTFSLFPQYVTMFISSFTRSLF